MRRAQRADLERIVELLQQLSLDDVKRERDPSDPAYQRAFDEIERDPRQVLVVVESDDARAAARIVGTATLTFIPNLSHGGQLVAQLESVVVDENERGRGAGELLVQWCLDEARRRGAFRAQLTSNSQRKSAHRFWEKLGFKHTHAGFKQMLE